MSEKEFFIDAVQMVDIDGSVNLPTALFYGENERLAIGVEARIQSAKYPQLPANEDFKIELGEISRRSASMRARFPCADGTPRSATQLASDFLFRVLQKSRAWLSTNGIAEDVNLLLAEPLSLSEELVEAGWLANYRQNLRKIVEGTPGIKHVDFLPEPFAVFQYYRHGLRHPIIAETAKHYALVIDFGGGTCDVCIIESTKDGDISQTGRNSKPLAADSHPTGGYYINRLLAQRLYRQHLARHVGRKDDLLEKGLDTYEKWRKGDLDLTVLSEENRRFIANFQQVVREVEQIKIALSRQITNWKLELPISIALPISLPRDPFSDGRERAKATISASDFREVFVGDVWRRLKSKISSTLHRGKQELGGSQISVVLLSGGSANVGWLQELLRRDFPQELLAAEILHAPDYQEVVARGLAVECARRYYSEGGDFASVTYNRLCLLLNPDERGIELREFVPRTDGLPDLKGLPAGTLLPSASAMRNLIETPMRWRVRLDHPPQRRLDYYFMRSLGDPDDLENLHNIADHTVRTPPQTKFDSAIQIELRVAEDGTATPTFVYRTGRTDEERISVTARPFYLDMTFGDAAESPAAYLGLDFGTSNTAISYIDQNSVHTFQKRAGESQWRELSDLTANLPYPLAAPLKHYLGQIEKRALMEKGRDFIESALCLAAYVAYCEYCSKLQGQRSSRFFRGFTQRSAGPLWGLLRDCLRALGERAEISQPLQELETPEFLEPLEQAITAIAKYKHDKADAAEIDLLRPIQILANVSQKVFEKGLFGFFENVKKKKLSREYEGIFRHAVGSPPFIHFFYYAGSESFSQDEAIVVFPQVGTALPLSPLVFWDTCERHPDLSAGHCFVFDASRRGDYSYKAIEYTCTRNITVGDGRYSELTARIGVLEEFDSSLELVNCGRLTTEG